MSDNAQAKEVVEAEEEQLKEVLEVETELSLTAKVGSLLFVSTKPIAVESLAQAAKATVEEVEEALSEITESLSENVFGFSLYHVGGAWQLRTATAARKTINRLIPPKARKLSRAAAETLAVVAYRQPVQRGEVEAIRGVDALQTLKTLLDAKLIRIVGREQTAGHPALYGTTEFFLEKFGLGDLSELPSIRELEDLAEEPEEFNPDSESETVDASSEIDSEETDAISEPQVADLEAVGNQTSNVEESSASK